MSYYIMTKSGVCITFNQKAVSFDSDIPSFNNDGLISFFDKNDELVAVMPASSIACIFRDDTNYEIEMVKSQNPSIAFTGVTSAVPNNQASTTDHLHLAHKDQDGKWVLNDPPKDNDIQASLWLSQESLTNSLKHIFAESCGSGNQDCKCR